MKIGILGAAQIAPTVVIEPAPQCTDVAVAAVAARDVARATAFAREHNVPRVVASYGELIADAAIDLVYIPTPISAHARWSTAALAAGKPVLCEKPLAINAQQAEDMLAATTERARLIEAFHCLYHPAYETLREWLDDPAAGVVTAVDAFFNVALHDNGTNIRFRPELGGGAMMDLGCYPVMWARLVCGAEPMDVAADAAMTTSGVDLSMRATLVFNGGATARVACSMAENQVFASALAIQTEHSRIDFTNPLQPQHGRLVRHIGGREEVAALDARSTYYHQLKSVTDALRQGKVLPTEGRALLAQQRTLDRVYAAAGLGHLREV